MNPDHSAILRATDEHRSALIGLLSNLNSRAESQCLHCDTERDGITVEIDKLLANSSIPLIAAFAEGQLIGALGCELNEAGTHCWLRGPFLHNAPQHSAALPAMFDALAATLPRSITDMMAFPNVDNTLVREFYAKRGFGDTHTIHIYTAPRPVAIPAADPAIQEYHSGMFGELDALHNSAFPTAVERTRDVVDGFGPKRTIFVVVDNGALAGYIAVSISDTPIEGFVDFLAVHPSQRGKGIGERLLKHAMHWFFAEHNMPQAGLCVRDNLANARKLYERAGFSLFASGVGMRRTIA